MLSFEMRDAFRHQEWNRQSLLSGSKKKGLKKSKVLSLCPAAASDNKRRWWMQTMYWTWNLFSSLSSPSVEMIQNRDEMTMRWRWGLEMVIKWKRWRAPKEERDPNIWMKQKDAKIIMETMMVQGLQYEWIRAITSSQRMVLHDNKVFRAAIMTSTGVDIA